MSLAATPTPPYYAVIFTSLLADEQGYAAMAERMVALAQQQPGFLGMESARNNVGITVSYWRSLDDIKQWKLHSEHQQAQQLGRSRWYQQFAVRIAKVERDYRL
ncbi:antibiotic biosynthesis monooxygenase [uncultured Ferrimonas sp.]|uniref:antibiotic biosynthesis monooxygenase family protein n=1 Tax=uncultured Ferrimonas sp. TaxID=432640 RepID=UPI0026280CD3|nr:antibiotic biosynthesis monooxygenase [uncultured Ferrimonas sp.]